jgi:hypothetical protein
MFKITCVARVNRIRSYNPPDQCVFDVLEAVILQYLFEFIIFTFITAQVAQSV